METRSDILGILTELIEEEVSLEETIVGLQAIEKLGTLPPAEAEDALLDEVLADMIDVFQDKRTRLKDAAERKVHEHNQKEKEAIIEEMRSLIQNEENIGKAFGRFNELQETWKDIGEVPREQYSRIQSEYSRLRETFFYNISIYKELAEHDKRRNLGLKQEIIQKVAELDKESNIKKVDSQVKVLIKEWDAIGPTSQKDWESIRDDFWKVTRKQLDRVGKYYEGLREKQGENLEKKRAQIAIVNEVLAGEYTAPSHWKAATEKVIQAQKEWKKIGFSTDNEEVWQEFRSAADAFFDKKNEFYGERKEVYSDRKAKKEALIEKAAELKNGENFKQTSEALRKLQMEWKEIGSAGQRDENKLWKRFRGHCDEFFNKKTTFFKAKEGEERENLKLKEDLITRVKAFEMTGNKGTDLNSLQAFGEEWRGISYVPFKDKDRVNKEYFESISVHYDKLRLGEREKKEVHIKNRLDSIKGDDRAKKDEKFQIRKQIEKLQANLKQYENNLGFFNPHQANPFKEEVEKKMKRDRAKISELKDMMKRIDAI